MSKTLVYYYIPSLLSMRDPNNNCFVASDRNTEDEIQSFISSNENVKVALLENKDIEDLNTDDLSQYLIANTFFKTNLITLYIDLDDTILDFLGKKEYLQNEVGMTFPQASYRFFEDLEPLPNAIKVVKELIDSPNFEVRFATAPSIYNPMSYTEKRMSIEKHFGFEHVDKLFILTEKDRLDKTQQGLPCILIDDIKEGYGQERFENKIHFGSSEYPDWLAVRKKLLGK